MDYNLDLAIELYERERLALESKIKDYLEDYEGPDYHLAGYHQKALHQIENTLRTLKSFSDPLFQEKERSLSKIKIFENELKKNNPIFPAAYLATFLEEEKERLVKLNSVPIADHPPLSETILDKAISDLIKKEIKKFKLVLDKRYCVRFEFVHSNGSIKITLPNIRQHLKNGIFYESQIEYLKKYGFSSISVGKLQAVIKLQNHQDTYQYVRFLLVKVIFEVLYYTGNQEGSFIEF